ncbi:MAG: hypothetical protein Q9M17_04940 [Mariprofundus sp.]|nr:hypothetical protein [Mariprofundus sp.]
MNKVKYLLLFSFLLCGSLVLSNKAMLVPFVLDKDGGAEGKVIAEKTDVKPEEEPYGFDESECDSITAVTTYKDKKCGDGSIPEYEWIMLKPGHCAKVTVYAKSRWNASNLKMGKGKYIFRTNGKQVWNDATNTSDVYGWGGRGYGQRISNQPLFRMIGVVSPDCCKEQTFAVDLDEPQQINNDGQFCAYANDHPWFYSNNSGSIELMIKRSKEHVEVMGGEIRQTSLWLLELLSSN